MIFRGTLNSSTGASKVVKTFDDNKNEFINKGFDDFRTFSFESSDLPSGRKGIKKLLNPIRHILGVFLRLSYTGCCKSIDNLHFKRAEIIVKRYLASGYNADIIIFHDILDCYKFISCFNQKKLPKILLIMHTNGKTWDTFCKYYPKIVNSKYMGHLLDIEKYTCEKCDSIVFVSNGSRNTFIKYNPDYEKKTSVILNGIDDRPSLSHRQYDNLNLITVGTLNKRKNQIAIIEALVKIPDKTIRLTLVGDGEMKPEWMRFAEQANLSDQVSFLGNCDNVPELLDNNNVFIMASTGEGLPIAGIEAIRSGLPMILTDVGGNSELIKENGLLIGTSSESIKNAILYLNDNKDILKEYGDKSRKLFETLFDSKTMIASYVILLKRMIASEI